MRLLIAASLILALATPAFAQDEEEDPIDTTLAGCLDLPSGQSTAGMVQCLVTAYGAWDAALNEAYKDLMASLDPGQKDALRESQRAWLAYRDAEQKFLRSLANAPGVGTIINITTNQAMVDLVKARVLLLRSYSQN